MYPRPHSAAANTSEATGVARVAPLAPPSNAENPSHVKYQTLYVPYPLTCDSDCTAAGCGDGIFNLSAGEQCDDGAQSPGCDADCTTVECGDGIENNSAGEFCDDGNNDDGDGCSAVCTNEEPSSTTDVSGSSEGGSSEGGSTGGGVDTGDTDVGTTADTAGDTADTAGEGVGDTSATAGTSGGASASGSETTTSGAANDSSGGSGAGDDGGATGGNNTETGCGCTTDDSDDRRGTAWSVIALLGLGAVTRRRR